MCTRDLKFSGMEFAHKEIKQKMMFRSIIAKEVGGPEVLQIVETDLIPPTGKEVWIEVLAVPICLPDIQARYALSLFPPKLLKAV